jgi:type III secretory pathway component EscT
MGSAAAIGVQSATLVRLRNLRYRQPLFGVGFQMYAAPVPADPIVVSLSDWFAREHIDWLALGAAWVRLMPAVSLVPAFGLKVLPAPLRVALALMFAVVIQPAVRLSAVDQSMPWLLVLALEFVRGLPIAVLTAAITWAATSAGSLTDQLRGSSDAQPSNLTSEKASSSGVMLSLLSVSFFLLSGGPARLVRALMLEPMASDGTLRVVATLNASVQLSLTLAAPMLVASLVVEVGSALIARAANPAQVQPMIAPMRGIGLLMIMGICFDRMSGLLQYVATRTP